MRARDDSSAVQIERLRQSAPAGHYHGRTLTLEGETWFLRLGPLRCTWQRPTAVHIAQAGHSKSVPIPDVTRRIQFAALLFIGLNVIFAVWRHHFQN